MLTYGWDVWEVTVLLEKNKTRNEACRDSKRFFISQHFRELILGRRKCPVCAVFALHERDMKPRGEAAPPRNLGVFSCKSRGFLVSNKTNCMCWELDLPPLPPYGRGPAEGFFLLHSGVGQWVSVKRLEAILIVIVAVWIKLYTNCAVVWRVHMCSGTQESDESMYDCLTISEIIGEPVKNVRLFFVYLVTVMAEFRSCR